MGKKNEIFLGDSAQGVWLKFTKDHLWVAGFVGEKEIPHKPIPWSVFDQARNDSKLDYEPTLYERYKAQNEWRSDAPDMRSFKAAVEYFFHRDTYRLGGRFFHARQYEKPDEHLCLLMGEAVLWDFGPLNGADDAAYAVAFRRFEDSLERIRERVLRDASIWTRFCQMIRGHWIS